MSNGRIVWVSDKFQAVVLDGSHWLSLADNNTLDVGVYDLAIEILFNWDSGIANPGDNKLLISKSPGTLGGTEAGWEILMNPTAQSLIVRFNDSTATIITNTYSGILPSDTWIHLRLEFDRDSTLHLYKDGVLIDDTFDLSSRPGSVSNSEPLMIGHQTGGSNDYFDGYIGLIRIDGGMGWVLDADGAGSFVGNRTVDYGDSWNLRNYYALQYAYPRTIQHYLAAWYFDNSLVDDSGAALTLTWNGGGSASYGTGWPYECDYQFTYNPLNAGGVQSSWIPLSSALRSLDGSLKMYVLPGPNRQLRSLNFRTNNIEQIMALQGAYLISAPIHLYETGEEPFQFRGYLPIPPIWREVFSTTTKKVYEISLEIEEL